MTKSEMTYQILELKLENLRANDALNELRTYLLSDKFHDDPTVRVADVIRRLDEVRLTDYPTFRKGFSLNLQPNNL